MAYVKVTLDGVTHELNPQNLCILRDQIQEQCGQIGFLEAANLAVALKVSVKQLMQFLTGLKKNA